MNKLLVILLLFFPVHGAWGETISIKCTDITDIGKVLVLHLDMSNKYVLNNTDRVVAVNLRTKGHMIYFDVTPNYIKKMRDGDFPDFQNVATTLDRTTGDMRMEIIYDTKGNSQVTNYQCEKHHGKRKF